MPTFFVLSGADVGASAQLTAGATIGRGAEAELRLRDRSISRLHARVERRGERWFLVDAGSRNGLFVGQRRLQELELVDGTELRLGDLEMRVRLVEPVAAPPTLPTAPPPPRSAPAPDDDEIRLEEPDDDEPAPAPRAAPPPLRREPPPAATAPPARGVLQYHRVEPRQGLMASELAQQSPLTRAALAILALAFAAAIAFGTWRAILFLKARSAPAPIEPVEEY